MLSRTAFVAASVFAAAVLAGQPSFAANGVPQPAHIVVVMEENHAYNQIIGSTSAPYINSLASQGALFTDSYAIEHPSQPNYLDIFTGGDQGVTSDSCPQNFTVANLGAQLLTKGFTFKGYSEGLPGVGSFACTNGEYARKHVPWTDFDGKTNNVPTVDNDPFKGYYPGTISPVNYNNLPTVSFVIPNLDDDMHDGTIQQADSWLQTNIDGYAQWAKTNNSLLIVTWDEDNLEEGNHITTIFVGQDVKLGQYSNYVNHYVVLRTIEDAFGLPYADNAATVSPITNIWN